jgi:hypothetical protein
VVLLLFFSMPVFFPQPRQETKGFPSSFKEKEKGYAREEV